MKSIIVQQGQNLTDIAIQEFGDVSAVLDIAKINCISVTDDVRPGANLRIPDVGHNEMSILNLNPATANGGEVQLRIFTEQYTKEYK